MNTRKILRYPVSCFFFILVILFRAIIANAQSVSIDNGLTWLLANQNADGSWSQGESKYLDTYSTLETLYNLNAGSTVISKGLNWIASQNSETSDDLSHRIYLLTKAEKDISTEMSLLLNALNTDNGWGADPDFSSEIIDTTFALRALKAADYSDQELVISTIWYLLRSQNGDGGWGFYEGTDSNVYMTALVSSTLQQFTRSTLIAGAINNATGYLLTKQNSDGGFGSSPSTAYESALAYMALAGKITEETVLGTAVNYIKTTQLADGSWDDDPYSTALALRALARVKPNLFISAGDISFSDQTPVIGDIVTVSAVIHNSGPVQADTITVRFYEGNPSAGGVQIGTDQTITLIAPFSSVTVDMNYDTAGKIGRYDIYVTIDPSDQIAETDESDNTGFNTLTVFKSTDLSVDAGEIIHSPLNPTADTVLTIVPVVRNLSENVIINVPVALYEGLPGQGGILLAEDIISYINPISSAAVHFEISGQSIGLHNYYVYVDHSNQISEADESNNIALRTIDIKDPNIPDPDQTDLAIRQSDISINPIYPETGQSVTIAATIHNHSNHYIYNTNVSFYNGDPDSGGILLGTVTPYVIYQMNSVNVSYSWTMPGGVPVIYVVVDKNNAVAENNEANNTAWKVINTYSADLSVTEKDVALSPVLPERGQPATLNITVNNLGNVDASGTLGVYEVHPDGERTLIGESRGTVPGAGSSTLSIDGWTYPEKSGTIALVISDATPGDSDLSNNEAEITYGEDIRPGSSNNGKDFWITWPETNYRTAEIIIQSQKTSEVTAQGNFVNWTGVVSPGSPVTVPLVNWQQTRIVSNGVVEDKGIHISSDEDISVIFRTPIVASIEDDAYLAIPTDTLGTEYYSIGYKPQGASNTYSRVTVAAAHDNTTISIDGAIVTLHKGQTYQIKSNTIDHTGVYVRSDKPIAVVSGVSCISLPQPTVCAACDTLLAQMLPVSLWGTDYFTSPFFSPGSGDRMRILAEDDNTSISINRGNYTETILLNRGEWRELDVEPATHITSNLPVQVVQYAKGLLCAGVGDPLEMVVIPTDKLKMTYQFYVPAGYDQGNFATVIAPEAGTNIFLDGINIVPVWQGLPDRGEYALIDVVEGEHIITSDKPIAVYTHGYRRHGSYGYPGGFVIPVPDLTVGQISISPQNPSEGQIVRINTTVSNLGEKWAHNILIQAYNGDPATGGVQVGEDVIIDIMYPMESVPSEFIWDTTNFENTNNIYVVVDPLDEIKEDNEYNNSSMITVNVVTPVKPDLTFSAVAVSPEVANEGEEVTVSATIRNRGSDVSDVLVNLYLGAPDSGGLLLDSKLIRYVLPLHSEITIDFIVETVGLQEENDLYIMLDPENAIDELVEDNNQMMKHVHVIRKKIGLDVETDSMQYEAQSDVSIDIYIKNEGAQIWSGTGSVYIEDTNSTIIEQVATFNADNLKPLGINLYQFTWNTGTSLPENYRVYVTLAGAENVIATGSSDFEILPDMTLGTTITTDKIEYNANETALITLAIQNAGMNYIFEDLTATVTVKESSGLTLQTEDGTIGMLTPASYHSIRTYWNTSTFAPGVYPVTLEVKDSTGAVLATSTVDLTISSEIIPSKLLLGSISVDQQSLLQGTPVNISYSISNAGNIDLSQVDISIPVVHVVEMTPHDTLTDQASLGMGESFANSQTLSTQIYTAKDYLVVLRASISGVEETLAATYFRVEGAPSPPSLNWPIHGEDVETLIPELIVNNATDPNDDELTYEFELYADSGLTTLLASESGIAEGLNTTSWYVPFELTENSMYVWRARTFDGILHGDWMTPAAFRVNVTNEPPTAPTLSGPVDGSSSDTFTPILTVNNASDPDSTELIYNFEVALDADITNIVASEAGVTAGDGTTSWQVPVALLENTTYYWRAQADDWLVEGPWITPASFFVNTANEAPSAPHIVAPLEGVEVLTLNTDISAAGAIDPDLDPLFYLFETDTALTFDSPGLMISGNISEGAMETIWNAAGLSDNTTYYVRVNANDSLVESPWSTVVSFFVNTEDDAPTIPVLANPSDGGAVNVFNPTLSVYNSTDLDGDVLTYEFEVYTEPAMVNLVESVSSVAETQQITSWTITAILHENQTCYWRARTFDGELYSSWMPLSSFMVNTANDAPGAPTLNSPAYGASIETPNPTLSINNSPDPDSDTLTYDFEIYDNGVLIQTMSGIPEDASGITTINQSDSLSDNTTYQWRARAFDGDRYGPWMDMASFSIHLPVNSITANVEFRPRTLNKEREDRWLIAYIELPKEYDVHDIDRSSILLEGSVSARSHPYRIGDHDRDGIPDLMVKFKRSDVIDTLPEGDEVSVTVTGIVGTTTFEGIDSIRVIPEHRWRHHPPRKRCRSNHYWKRESTEAKPR